MLVLALAATLCLGAPAGAWVDHNQSFPAVKVATPPSLDPALTDPIWQTGLTMTNFYNYTTRTAAKNTTIRNGKGTPSHFIHSNLSITCSNSQSFYLSFNTSKC